MLMSIDQSLSSSGIIVWQKDIAWLIISSNKDDTIISRIRFITNEIKELIEKYDVTHVVIESLPYGINSTSVRPLAGLYFCIGNLCEDLGIHFDEANVTAVKKYATGSGKAKKADMIEAFKESNPELFKKITNSNVRKTTGLADLADAYWIGAYYGNKLKEEN